MGDATTTEPRAGPAAVPPMGKGGSLALLTDSQTGFSISVAGEGDDIAVPVHFARHEDSHLWEVLFESDHFRTWASQYENNESFSLNSVEVKSIKISETGAIEYALIEPIIKNSEGQYEPTEPLFLSGTKVCVLIMLKCTRAESEDFGSFAREYALFASESRPNLGNSANLEILTGHFNENDEFIFPGSEQLESVLKTKIRKVDLDSLLKHSRTSGISSTHFHHETKQLYLYRQRVTEEDIAQIPKSGAFVSSTTTLQTPEMLKNLRLVSLTEAWKISDAVSMAALMIFHEFRYHGLMPPYRPSRDKNQSAANIEKRKPHFTQIDKTYPTQTGINLRVKVVTPMIETDTVDPVRGERRVKEEKISVGDATGIVDLKLEGDQLLVPDIQTVGTNLIIRNAVAEVVEEHMLIVVNKWGKVTVPTEEDLPTFDFEANLTHNHSQVEYELVAADNAEGGALPGGMGGGSPGRGRGGGRGRRGRGRGGPRRGRYN